MQAQTATATKSNKAAKIPPKGAKPTKGKADGTEAAPIVVMEPTTGDIGFYSWSQTVLSVLNSRRNKHTREELESLAALIYSQKGVLQNLIGFKQKKKGKETGLIEIVAGGGRHGGVGILIEQGKAKPDFPLPIKIVSEEQAIAASIAENFGRKPPHLADEITAMLQMIEDQGKHPQEVAAAFGITMQRMNRRLALAKVSSRLFEMFRNDEMSYEQISCFTLVGDHAAQEAIWNSAKGYMREPHQLRQLCTKQKVSTKSDAIAKYVGISAYEKAGGTVVRDLFSEKEQVYMSDIALLEHLATEKLNKSALLIGAQGWAWVEVIPRADCNYVRRFQYAPKTLRSLIDEEQATRDQLSKEFERINAEIKALEEREEDLNEEESNKLDTLYQKQSDASDELDAFDDSMLEVSPEVKKHAGVLLRVEDGKAAIHYGLIKKDDIAAAMKAVKRTEVNDSADENDNDDEQTESAPKAAHSAKLARQLTSHRTAALQAVLMEKPNIALVAMTHRMARSVFFSELWNDHSCVELSMQHVNLSKNAPDMEGSRAFQAIEKTRLYWTERFAEVGESGLFAWLLEQKLEDVLKLMSFCVATSVSAVEQIEKRNATADELEKALDMDMADWWTPTAEAYFDHVSKKRMGEVVMQNISIDAAKPLETMKKAEAAGAAARAMDGCRWIPDFLKAD